MTKKAIILSIILGLGILPTFATDFAKIEGGISRTNSYDTEKTIMSDTALNKAIKTGKYWEKNMFYSPKYRPLFMLSNRELYDLMPSENISVVQRISTPSVYNISLKSASIRKVSLTTPIQKQENDKTVNKPDVKSISSYEEAKNPQTEPEKKVEAALLLKNSQNVANYHLAIDLLDDVTAKEPYNAYAYYLKGELYRLKRDSQNAMKNYVEALKINPISKQCYFGIAKVLEPTNKELAQKYYERAK